MASILKVKRVSYGLVELCQSGSNYYIQVNGQIKEMSSDLTFIVQVFESKYN